MVFETNVNHPDHRLNHSIRFFVLKSRLRASETLDGRTEELITVIRSNSLEEIRLPELGRFKSKRVFLFQIFKLLDFRFFRFFLNLKIQLSKFEPPRRIKLQQTTFEILCQIRKPKILLPRRSSDFLFVIKIDSHFPIESRGPSCIACNLGNKLSTNQVDQYHWNSFELVSGSNQRWPSTSKFTDSSD